MLHHNGMCKGLLSEGISGKLLFKNKTKHISKECLAHASCDLENPAAQYVEQTMLYFMQVCVTISQQQRRIISQQ